jgi:hypothetical protein
MRWPPACRPALSIDPLADLLAIDPDVVRGDDAEADLVAPDVHHLDDDVVADQDAFAAKP